MGLRQGFESPPAGETSSEKCLNPEQELEHQKLKGVNIRAVRNIRTGHSIIALMFLCCFMFFTFLIIVINLDPVDNDKWIPLAKLTPSSDTKPKPKEATVIWRNKRKGVPKTQKKVEKAGNDDVKSKKDKPSGELYTFPDESEKAKKDIKLKQEKLKKSEEVEEKKPKEISEKLDDESEAEEHEATDWNPGKYWWKEGSMKMDVKSMRKRRKKLRKNM